MAVVEIPLKPQAQRFTIALAGTLYRMRVLFNEADDAGWTLDIGTQDGTPILAGTPMVTGVDLLAQHRHLGIGGKLVMTSDCDLGERPSYAGLGTTAHLYFIAD